MSTSAAVPLSIDIQIPAGVSLKSLESFKWEEVPDFVVLTGANGSGKTQLLELIAHKIAGVPHCSVGEIQNVTLKIEGDGEFDADSVAYIPSRWDFNGSPTIDIASVQQTKRNTWSQVTQHNHHDARSRTFRAKLQRLLGTKNLQALGEEAFNKLLPDDLSFLLDERDFTAGLAPMFLAYRLRIAEAREARLSDDEARAAVGVPPWDLLNKALEVSGFQFRVPSPIGTKLLDPLQLRLRSTTSELEIWPGELSSGEQVILGMLVWLYRFNNHSGLPKLLLLDEPDAHLHPSMTRQLMDVLHKVLVKQHHVRVILTTHSPSTVALAPDNSVFEMRPRHRDPSLPRISLASSKADVIGRLTAGLVIVSHGTRQVLVEDQHDVQFFEAVREILTDYGPTRDPGAIPATPSIVFVAASLGSGKVKIAGGKSVVQQWLEKLDAPPLSEIFRGVIDKDTGNLGDKRLIVIGRYSIENYYLDPLVVFVALIALGTAPTVDGATVSEGTEHVLRTCDSAVLQRIVDAIATLVEPHLGAITAAEKARQEVRFTIGLTLQYPAWVLERRGHDLLPSLQSAFGGPSAITPPRMISAFKRLRLIPSELAAVMRRLQEP